ncbi:hypothetical protein Pst134EA_004731 [Puccinia striiformis f. sp. tritici]|uniref:hypothetical protein n=1 Tax=Puccinia striiformis f. sp. tritici TaxID=168172 RepID=UPI0020089700|nr:hypothetical protein Pst134EA_004731 [Puccinia striiformis f. sp. tritici]KAH9470809.1 hypothetical protein Pst134EA_004731 [Puccinia striiformis f. sp. tritici]
MDTDRVFTDVKPSMKIHREEIFGPAVVVMKFVDEEDVIEQANDTIYGLASAIHSKNITKALRVSRRIQAGLIVIIKSLLRSLLGVLNKAV